VAQVQPIEIEIPYAPRRWAARMHVAITRWAVLVLHRRAGKTTASLNHHQMAALDDDWERERLRRLLPAAKPAHLEELLKGRVYWHVMPSYKQAELVGWKLLQGIADPVLGRRFNQQKLRVTYPRGHSIQLLGADDPDSLRGPGLSGLSLDEYSQIPGNAFGEVLSKSLADHLGYCIWLGTIKGTDQLYQVYQAAKTDREWFALWQDVDASLATESGATIEALRRAMEDDRKLVLQGLMTQAEFDQEWYLSTEAAIKGAFYADQIAAARTDGRITAVPYDPALLVDTDWDLGIDAMAVWYSQSTRAGDVRLIDYDEDVGGGLPAMIKRVREKPYTYGEHWGPHDIEVREISSGLTRRQAAGSLGVHFKVTPKILVSDGITAAQLLMARCWFDERKTKEGLHALRHYKRTWNQHLARFMETPIHDWASHGADAFRGLAVRYQPVKSKSRRRERFEGRPASGTDLGWMR